MAALHACLGTRPASDGCPSSQVRHVGSCHEPSNPWLGLLGGSWRHVHRCRGPAARRQPRLAQAAERGSTPLRRRGHRRYRRPARIASGRAAAARTDQVGEDGYHGGHECAAAAPRRADPVRDHGRIRRCAAHRVPDTPAPVHARHRAARDALFGGARGRRASCRGRHGAVPAGYGAGHGRHGGGAGARPGGRRHRAGTRLPAHPARGRAGSRGARDRFLPGLGQPRGGPAGQDRPSRRHHRGRRLPVPDPAQLRRRCRVENRQR